MLSLQEGEFLSTSISSLVPGFCSMLQYFVAVCTEAGGGRSTLCACRLRGDSLDKRPPYLGQGKSGPGTHQQGHSRPRSSSHVLKCFGIQYKVNDPFLSLRLFGLRSEAWRCPGPASSCGCMSGANYFIWMHAMRQLLYLDAYHVPTTSFGCLSGKKKPTLKACPVPATSFEYISCANYFIWMHVRCQLPYLNAYLVPTTSVGSIPNANYFIWMHAQSHILHLNARSVPTTWFGCIPGPASRCRCAIFHLDDSHSHLFIRRTVAPPHPIPSARTDANTHVSIDHSTLGG